MCAPVLVGCHGERLTESAKRKLKFDFNVVFLFLLQNLKLIEQCRNKSGRRGGGCLVRMDKTFTQLWELACAAAVLRNEQDLEREKCEGRGEGEKRRKQPARKLDSQPTPRTPNPPLDSCHEMSNITRNQNKPTWNKMYLTLAVKGEMPERKKSKRRKHE